MRPALIAAAAASLLFVAPLSAQAQEAGGSFSFNAALTSDYVWRGFSQSDTEAAVQAGVDYSRGGFYAGTWASTVEFGDDTDMEWDFYAGYTTSTGSIDWDFGITYYNYVGDPKDSGYNFTELKVAASHSFDSITVGAAVHHSFDFYGADESATYAELSGGYEFTDKWSFSAGIGRQFLDVSANYTTWNLGVGYNITDTIGLDFRFWDSTAEGPLSDQRVTATVGVAF